jgi:hypothetical protein
VAIVFVIPVAVVQAAMAIVLCPISPSEPWLAIIGVRLLCSPLALLTYRPA